ncbi:MAG: hypothetical protein KOO63_00285 [Bacteroidales bacterium]|nr:hypothetical protein [Candidatus Latescibacterota bacterium]
MLLENHDQIQQKENQIAERGQALLLSVEKNEAIITKKSLELEDALKAQAKTGFDSADRDTIKKVVGKANGRALNELRRSLVEDSADHRKGIMAVVDEYLIEVEQSASLFRSPLQVLSRHGMGDPKKTELISQLTGSGVAELQGTIAYAVATGDKLTLSAALLVADRGGKKYQSVDRAQLAQDAMGKEVAAVQIRLEELRTKLTAMKTTNKIFERGVSNNQDKIKAGLAARALDSRREKAGL